MNLQIVDPMTLPSKNLASIQLTDSKAVAGKQCEIFGWKIQISGQPIHADILTSANVIILGKDKCDNEDLILDDTSVCVGPNYVKACDVSHFKILIIFINITTLSDRRRWTSDL